MFSFFTSHFVFVFFFVLLSLLYTIPLLDVFLTDKTASDGRQYNSIFDGCQCEANETVNSDMFLW